MMIALVKAISVIIAFMQKNKTDVLFGQIEESNDKMFVQGNAM